MFLWVNVKGGGVLVGFGLFILAMMVHCSAVLRSWRRGGKNFFFSMNQFQSHVEYTCVSLPHVFSNKIFMLFHSKNLQVVAVKVYQMIYM